jgi:hypothetical protein
MVNAFKAGKDSAEAVIPETRIIILSTGDPGKRILIYGISPSNLAA